MQKQHQENTLAHHDEYILVVKRSTLFPEEPAWQGLQPINKRMMHIIEQEQEFHPRSLMESDPTFKQIIPYLVFTYKGSYFLMQRRSDASEQRLKNKFSLGIGGHIRKEDITSSDIISWAQREFHEEIAYSGTYQVTPLGIINDDSTEVGRVHLGLVLVLEGSSPDIAIASELKFFF